MSKKIRRISLAVMTFTAGATAGHRAVSPVHDPCIIHAGANYYVFSTGPGIAIRTSTDLIHWQSAGRVFKALPDWIERDFPKTRTLWAPDISFINGQYRLYYAVSTFGSNRSVIGLATNSTLDATNPAYAWVDHGKVIETTHRDDWNAIDPAVFLDEKNQPWMAAGSWYSGIKLIRLDPATGLVAAGAKIIPIAERANHGAIEAPFVTHHDGYFYLWVSFDKCCEGIKSTYNVRVGRSKSVEGPYVDSDGTPMLKGGGTMVLQSNGNVRGPGHCAVLHDGGDDYLVNHFYDATRHGAPTLQIRRLQWDDKGWPIAGEPLATESSLPSTMPNLNQK